MLHSYNSSSAFHSPLRRAFVLYLAHFLSGDPAKRRTTDPSCVKWWRGRKEFRLPGRRFGQWTESTLFRTCVFDWNPDQDVDFTALTARMTFTTAPA